VARDDDDFDLVVIGAGSGGVRAARVAAELGARVAIVEEGKLGGTCVNAGCIPKKLLVHASELAYARIDARGFGYGKATPSFDWRALVAAKDREIARLNGVYLKLLQDAGVQVMRGSARLEGPHAVQVGERRLNGKYLLLAVGGQASVPEIPGRELGFTSDAAFHLPALSERVLVVGGGYIAVEFAGIFRGLGVDVQMVHRGEQILAGFDHDLREHLARELKKQGIAIRCNALLKSIAAGETGLRVELSDAAVLETDAVMFAVGRVPRTRGLGLEEAGIALAADGAVLVDDYGRSSLPHVFAVGDCKGGLTLTPVAIADGQAAAHTMFGAGPCCPADPDKVPTAVFSQPPLATVGLTEEEARGCYDEVEVYRSAFTPLKHRLTGRATQSLVKLVVDKPTQRVVGVHMVGEGAPEIMQGFAVALQCGATKAQLDATIGIHPTAAEELVTLRARVS
jgi:glutathione reductase (NADPH)